MTTGELYVQILRYRVLMELRLMDFLLLNSSLSSYFMQCSSIGTIFTLNHQMSLSNQKKNCSKIQQHRYQLIDSILCSDIAFYDSKCNLNIQLSLISQLSPIYDIYSFVALGNPSKIICSVVVISSHREILKSKSQDSCFPCDWIKTMSTSIFEMNSWSFLCVVLSEFLKSCGHKMLSCGHRLCSKYNTLFFLFYQCGWFYFFEGFEISFEE